MTPILAAEVPPFTLKQVSISPVPLLALLPARSLTASLSVRLVVAQLRLGNLAMFGGTSLPPPDLRLPPSSLDRPRSRPDGSPPSPTLELCSRTCADVTIGLLFIPVFIVSGFFAADAEERKTNMTRRKYGYPEKKYMDGKFKIFSRKFKLQSSIRSGPCWVEVEHGRGRVS